MGIVGPAIALVVGYLLVIVLSGIALRSFLARPLRATWPLRERFALVAAYGAGFAAAHMTENAVPYPYGLFLSLFAGTIAYAGAFLIFDGINVRDRHRLIEIIGQARSWREQRATS